MNEWLDTEQIAALFAVSIRTAKNYVRRWAEQQSSPDVPRVKRARGATRRWQYWVEAASVRAVFPVLESAATSAARASP